MTLSPYDTERIYEWYLALTQAMGKHCCEHCKMVVKKLEKNMDKESIKMIKLMVKKRPYFKNGKIIKKK